MKLWICMQFTLAIIKTNLAKYLYATMYLHLPGMLLLRACTNTRHHDNPIISLIFTNDMCLEHAIYTVPTRTHHSAIYLIIILCMS